MNFRRSRCPRTGRTSSESTRAAPYMPTAIDIFAKVRGHERAEQLRAAREADVLPYFRRLESPAAPVVEMEGAERIMLGSNNYLGLTSDERVLAAAHDALDRYGTGLTGSRLLNGTIDLHLELERELAEWMGTEDALTFSTGHQANLGALGTLLGPGDTVIADSADHASILDGCLLVAGQAAPVPPRPARQAREDARAGRRRRRRRARRRRRRVLDGGRHRRPAADRRAVPGARRAADGRRGARGRRARRPRRRRQRAARRGGGRRPADGHVLQVAGQLRRLPRRLARGRSTSCASPRARSSSPPPPCRPRWAPRWRRCGSSAPPRGRRCSRACSRTPPTCARGCASSASRCSTTAPGT